MLSLEDFVSQAEALQQGDWPIGLKLERVEGPLVVLQTKSAEGLEQCLPPSLC